MYLHLGQEVVVRHSDIIGVFDMDNTTISPHTRDFLRKAENDGRVTYVSMELPKSFTVCAPKGGKADQVYISQIAPSTLRKRAKQISV
ncbi:MAG: DUF370 domain-containing protein [Clostridia bacterium]|nr:DUF370 domain-containing protein [Clostridia bacterium]